MRGTGVGRPLEPRTEFARGWPVYSGSTKIPCAGCGRPAWFGPRLTDLIKSGRARPGCADCLAEATARGYRPEFLANMGNPERPAYG